MDKRGKKMFKVRLILKGDLKNKYLSEVIKLSYSSSVEIYKILKDAEINYTNISLVIIENSIVDENYIVDKSCDVKLFPMIVGG